jgi:hypothetical protein
MLDEALAAGKTIVLTTHDLDQGLRAATRALILDRGNVVYDGSAKRYRCPRSLSPIHPAGKHEVKPVAAIVFKDIAIEYKNKEAFSSMLLFGLLVVVVFSFAFEGSDRKALAPGMLWVAYSFRRNPRTEQIPQHGSRQRLPAGTITLTSQPRRSLSG